METLFTKIIKGVLPSYKVAEDASCYAFLDINPNAKGHVLCVPKKAVDRLFDLPEAEYHQLMDFARKVALGMREVIPCKRIALSVIGLEVPHAHIHLIPIQNMQEATFQTRVQPTKEEFASLAASLQKAVAKQL
jgi:histidine triad (HIT) family protein